MVSDTAHSSAIGINLVGGDIGGLIATWAFLPFDRPNYRIGNGLNLAAQSLVLFECIGMGLWMRADNEQGQTRDVAAETEGLDHGEVEKLDWHHPGFEWRL